MKSFNMWSSGLNFGWGLAAAINGDAGFAVIFLCLSFVSYWLGTKYRA